MGVADDPAITTPPAKRRGAVLSLSMGAMPRTGTTPASAERHDVATPRQGRASSVAARKRRGETVDTLRTLSAAPASVSPHAMLSPGPDASMEELRAFCVTMLAQHDKALVEIVDHAKAERLADAKVALVVNDRLLKLEGQHASIEPWAKSIDEIVNFIPKQIEEADLKLRSDLTEFSGRLQASENHIKAVHDDFVFHVKDTFGRADDKLCGLVALVDGISAAMAANTPAINGTAAATFSAFNDSSSHMLASHSNQLESLGTAVAALTVDRPCHCEHLNILSARVDGQQAVITGFGVMRTEALNAQSRIIQAEAAIEVLKGHIKGAPVRMPPGVDPGADARAAFLPYMRDGNGAAAPAAPLKTYRKINDMEKLFDDKAASDSNYEYSANDKENGERWRRTIRGYFVSRNAVLAPILDFIEHEDNVEGVTVEMMEEACRAQGWMVEDLDRLLQN